MEENSIIKSINDFKSKLEEMENEMTCAIW